MVTSCSVLLKRLIAVSLHQKNKAFVEAPRGEPIRASRWFGFLSLAAPFMESPKGWLLPSPNGCNLGTTQLR